MDKTKRFITLECYKPYYTIDKRQYTPSYEDVSKYIYYTKIRLDMIARLDTPESFDATPKESDKSEYDPAKEEHKRFAYQRVVVLCTTNLGMNGFQDSLYITERCIKHLQEALDEAYGEAIPLP